MINKQLINLSSPASSGGNQEEGLILHLDANDVDSYDGDGSEWVDITNHEYTPATNVSEHFNTVLYSPSSSGITAITGVGFQPDLVWTKNRDSSWYHQLVDSVRGGSNTIYSNGNNVQGTSVSHIDSLDSDGFTVDYSENIGNNHVAWCFKAGGAPSGSDKVSIDGTSYSTMSVANLTEGTISIDKLSVNTNLGFSIVSYNGNQVSNATVAHGLGVKPELIIVKNLESAVSWGVWTTGISDSQVLRLDQTAAATTPATAYFEPQNNTSKFFSLGTNDETNHNDDYIAYCFASKRGVSKVGSYTGTGAAGNKVYTGFEPAFIMVKSTSFAERWAIYDNKRSAQDPRSKVLAANVNSAEIDTVYYNINFDRDGFTVDGTANFSNKNGETFIYYAVAKNTNETSLIPDTDLELSLDAASFPQKGESGYSNTPSTWTDSSGNSNNGTISGATFDSELGNYLDFDGSNDEVRLNSTLPASTFNNCTFEYWIKLDDLLETRHLYFHDFTSNDVNYIALSKSNTNNKLMVFGSAAHINIARGNTDLVANKWTHIAVTLTSSQIKIYINGELDATVGQSFSGFSNALYSTIGVDRQSQSSTGNKWLNGQVGQVRIYSTALTQDQIRQNYNFTKPNYPNGFDGTITSTTWNSGGYFQFDGSNDKITLPNTALSAFDTPYRTMTMWLWVDNQSSGTSMPFTIKGADLNFGLMSVEITNSSNTLKLQVGYGSVTSSLTMGTWNHIAIVQKDANYEGFLNGTSIGTSGSAKNTFSGTDFILGEYSGGQYRFKGRISDVKLYTKALTDAEVTSEYNKGE